MVKKRLTKENWIDAATTVLLTGGSIDHVRIDKLAKKLGITRGSFYYHFNSREELLKAILDKWRTNATESVISGLQFKFNSPQEQLLNLAELPLNGPKAFDAASIELALRGWARRDAMARSAIEEIDKYRTTYIQTLFIDLGYAEPQAADLAFLFYSYMHMTSLLPAEKKDQQAKERGKRILQFLIPPGKNK
jgi:AcrR family transcriptional regulator